MAKVFNKLDIFEGTILSNIIIEQLELWILCENFVSHSV